MKIVRIVCCFYLLMVGILAISPVSNVLAQDETSTEESLELVTTYPKMEGSVPYASFTFDVKLNYQGSEDRYFDLQATVPEYWEVSIAPFAEPDKRIQGMTLEPGKGYGQEVKVTTSPPSWLLLEPGEYKITLEAISEEMKASIDLTAVVTARYSLTLISPAEPPLSTKATAGRDNYISVVIYNDGSAVINDIKFSSIKTEGWTIEFSPDKVDSLAADDYQTIDVNIKPPPRTIAGDYSISLMARGDRATAQELDIRVTVETPTISGWVGVGIILLVIAGLAVIFMRFSRR